MIQVRWAAVADADELVRLRGVMLASVTGADPGSGGWREPTLASLRRRLAEPEGSMAVVVIDQPESADQPGRGAALAACAVGIIESRLGAPDNPTGEVGYIFNVVTDPGFRRRGYSRACLAALLDWYRRRGVVRVELGASPEGEPLYRSLGFVRRTSPTMRLRL